jgi:hypothetical protein
MSVEQEKHYLEILGDELSLALGKAVWAFARIEWLTYEYMKKLSSDSLDMLMGDQMFKARIKLVKHLVLRIEGLEVEKIRAVACIDRAEKLADQRNTIVHNPWQIWIDFDREDFVTEIQKYTKREKKLDLTAVRSFTESAQQTASDLQDALGTLTRLARGPAR